MNKDIENGLNDFILSKGITIAAISAKTGIADGTLYDSFRGKRKLRSDEFLKVCNFLGINPLEYFPIKKSG